MKPSLTDMLCTRCGLCCDGSLFADVELANTDEAAALEVLGLEIEDPDEDGDGLLLQPCRALKGKRCGIYPHRPDCCRTFECQLLQAVKHGIVGVEQARAKIAEALRRIARINQLIVKLGQDNRRLPLLERCAEVLTASEGFAANPKSNLQRAELRAAMTALERLIGESFLDR